MSKLEKFNLTLDNFDKEVANLRSVAQAYQKLENLILSYAKIEASFDKNNSTLNEIIKLEKKQIENISKALNDLLKGREETKLILCKLIEERMDILRKENKEFYIDLDKTIKIKLEDNKSQISQLIEYERNRIKDIIIDEFLKNTKTLELQINNQTESLLRGQKIIKYSIWGLGVIILIITGVTLANVFLLNG